MRRELEARTGSIAQIGGIRRFRFAEGPENGGEVFHVRTGAGLSYWVTPGKGMDIALAEVGNVPISWSSANGEQHAAFYDDRGINWLRSASGGLLMTCGLTQVGAPGKDGDRDYGLHGRIHHTPARQVSSTEEWTGDEYELQVRGVMDETSIFGSKLRLIRSISSRLGENRIVIRDSVENMGFEPVPHMMLYHFNFGFPLLSEDTWIELPDAESQVRDEGMSLSDIKKWAPPDERFAEEVIFHRLKADKETAHASIISPSFPGKIPGANSAGISVELAWSTATLPNLVQWRMPGAGEHVLGLEPSNCWTWGRCAERELGSLKYLDPGAQLHYSMDLSINTLN